MTTAIQAQMSITLNGTKSVSSADATAQGGASIAPDLSLILPKAFNTQWNATSNPDGTDLWSGEVDLIAGAASIDLTNLTQAALNSVVNATGKHIRAIAVLADAANADSIKIGTGASNGYVGIATLDQILAGQIRVATQIGAAAVDATHKTLDVAGTGTQKLYVLIIFGT